MRTLNSEELALVYGGGKTGGGGGCKTTYSCASMSKASKCSKSVSKSCHENHGKHLGWCNKKS